MSEKIAHEDKGEDTVAYELGYHLVPSLGEEDLALRVTSVQKAIEKAGGTPIAESYPQAFTLSYTMKRLRGGRWEKYDTSFFGWVRFTAPRAGMPALEDELRHDEHLIRHLLFVLDPVALEPAPVRREPGAKPLVKRQDAEEKGEVSEQELDKQIEQLIS